MLVGSGLSCCTQQLVLMIVSADLTDPTVLQATLDPVKPLQLSTITFNASILGSDPIDEVRLFVQECRTDLCFADDFNISMQKIANTKYQAQCTLAHEKATQIKYHFIIKSNNTWFDTESTLVTLETNNTIPGFELVLLFVSVGLLLMRRQFMLKK